jgi:hypothetical protein
MLKRNNEILEIVKEKLTENPVEIQTVMI